MKKLLMICSMMFLVSWVSAQQQLIPMPEKCVLDKGTFVVGEGIDVISSDKMASGIADSLRTQLRTVALKGQKPSGKVECVIDPTAVHSDEGYSIEVKPDGILLSATTTDGLFRGKEALLQMATYGQGKIRACRINDSPRYEWRGFMVDESRHFFGKEKIMQYIDIMASLRMNVFHWHLTDADGWRVEIKKYPKLTSEGAVGNWHDAKAPARFYTQEEIREVVAYAQARHIMVVPEFDMPGHATAVCGAYPHVSAGGEGRWKHFTFHPCKEETYHFIEDILDELFALFPSPYIHLGGDEVHHGNQVWFTDLEIQQFIKEKNLQNETGLEQYFIRRVVNMVAKKGRTAIVWDEAVDAGIPTDQAVVMWWRHDRRHQLLKALEKGYRVIMTPRCPMYGDFNQAADHKYGRVWGGFNTLEEVYAFPEPIIHLTQGYEDQIMGLQMSLWTERIEDAKRLDFMAFPRMAAVAEGGWTAARNKRYSLFMTRLPNFLKQLDKQHIYYYNPYQPSSTPEPAGPSVQAVRGE